MTVGQGSLYVLYKLCLYAVMLSIGSTQAIESKVVGGVEVSADHAPFLAALLQRNKSLRLAGLTLPAQVFVDSQERSFAAPTSHCGYGLATCADAQDTVCVIARGTNTFAEKVANCAAGGGVAVLIYNYFPAVFDGIVGSAQELPVLAVSGRERESLLSSIGEVVTFGYGEDESQLSFFCGGSYLGDGWVLTAAHCVADRAADDVLIAFGAGDYRDGRQYFLADRVHVHLEFSSTGASLAHDLALVSLKDLPSQLEGIGMASWDEQRAALASGKYAQVYGRGEQNTVALGGAAGTSGMSATAFVADMPLVDNVACAEAMPDEPLEGDMICAGNRAGVGTCFGDSGGPLIWRQDGQSKLLGVVSWGIGCGLEGYFDVFASVATYRESLVSVIDGEREELDGETVFTDSVDDGEPSRVSPRSGGGAVVWLGLIVLLIRRVESGVLLRRSRHKRWICYST